jgi:twinkle protein
MRPGYLVKPSELPDRENLPTYSTGWDLDHRIRIVRPSLFVVTGIPGHGKGQWVRALTFRLAKAHGWRTAFFTPEDPHERLKRDMKRFAKAHGLDPKPWMDQHFRISNPPDDIRLILSMVEAEMESAVFQHDCQVFALDPWNEISHNRAGRTDTEYVEEDLVDLKRKARHLKLMLIIVAHPRKIDEGRPNLYSISGSANWFNKCDHGVIVYRSTPEDKEAQIIIEKCKDHETMGIPGKEWMVFNKDTADFELRP